jgi:hypothetical protein
VTSFPAVLPSAAVIIAIQIVPNTLYCLQVLSCSMWQGENSGECRRCYVGKEGFLAEPESIDGCQLRNFGLSTL